MNFVFQDNGVSWRRPHLVVLRAEIREFEVHLLVELEDRDTGELRNQLFTWTLPADYVAQHEPTPEQTKKVLRDAYLLLACHEIDELLRVDATWQDPHLKDPLPIDTQGVVGLVPV